MNGERFGDGRSYLRLKEGHQSAARAALQVLTHKPNPSIPRTSARTQLTPPPSYVSLYRTHSMKHMPPEYADIEDFILDIISAEGERIRNIWSADEHGQYTFEITGTYRFCENLGRHHRKNHIYFVVHPVRNTYYQKCHDVECLDYRSRSQPIFSTPSKGSNKRGATPSNADFFGGKRRRTEY